MNEEKYKSNNFNKFSLPDINRSPNENICKRAKLDTGTFCNYKCSFCYYYDYLDKKTSFDIIKKRIDFLVKQDINSLDLSGGESTIIPEWFDILEYIKSKSDIKISCVSNGYKFSDFDFLQKSKDYGLSEILFSVHGHNEHTHDKIVGKRGAFKRIIKSIENAKKMDLKVRVNCTTSSKINNYYSLDIDYINLINSLNPLELNFITMNTWDNQEKSINDKYKEMTDKIKNAILKSKVKYNNIRYTPFCFLEDFEKYSVNIYQHIYDKYDWNIALYDYKENTKENLFKVAGNNRLSLYRKPKECLGCKFFKICDGIDGFFDVEPIKGKIIENVIHYRENFYE